ncbi:hypothetical protein EZV62_024607 [Acer yangbiense]|uniref:DUF4283 domain-containing protein n=1 Tax=Acer yangbiense TaxID=1000413 RepID=A0A5C7GWM5_9ROSI|nr:hypothetical protein EZV62_024607 [Acer yangbiense]
MGDLYFVTMNANDIVMLCASMSLKEIEGPVRSLKDELKDDGLKKLSLSLVGKVLANKLINHKAFKRVLQRIWKIHNAPLLCMTKRIGQFLGNMIRDVEKIDEGASGDCNGKFLRVWVAIDVEKPLSSSRDIADSASKSDAKQKWFWKQRSHARSGGGLQEAVNLPDFGEVPMKTDMEGVGKGKERLEIKLHADFLGVDDSKSHDKGKSKIVDKTKSFGEADNMNVIKFSSQRKEAHMVNKKWIHIGRKASGSKNLDAVVFDGDESMGIGMGLENSGAEEKSGVANSVILFSSGDLGVGLAQLSSTQIEDEIEILASRLSPAYRK